MSLMETEAELRARIAKEYGVDESAVKIEYGSTERLTILTNSNVSMSPKKLAAQAVHAALLHYGIEHGTVVVLGATPTQINAQCDVVIRDAGVTELKPGTLTAGVRRDESS
jgi:PTH2 family peptidyl-tRNA hydrolase